MVLWRGEDRGQRSGRSSLCHHVLLPLVEPHLAERHGAHHHIDGGGDKAVDADLLVQTVDVLRRVLTAGHTINRLSEQLQIDILSIS